MSQPKTKHWVPTHGHVPQVLPTYGHVRDLVESAGSVVPEQNFCMTWRVMEKAVKHVDSIEAALREAHVLILATDPDREGEAISWHLLQVLQVRCPLRAPKR